MKLKDDIEKGQLFVDAFSTRANQAREPKNVRVGIDGKECRGICTVKSIGSDRIILTVRVDEKGQIAENVPDFKASLGKSFDIQIQDGPDGVAFVASLEKLEEGQLGQYRLCHGIFEIMGQRSPLDFEPPTVTVPMKPFVGQA